MDTKYKFNFNTELKVYIEDMGLAFGFKVKDGYIKILKYRGNDKTNYETWNVKDTFLILKTFSHKLYLFGKDDIYAHSDAYDYIIRWFKSAVIDYNYIIKFKP